MALETELATYYDKALELANHDRYFVLIKGDKIVDYFKAYEDALKRGYDDFKLEPFLVKQIHRLEQSHFINPIILCHTSSATSKKASAP